MDGLPSTLRQRDLARIRQKVWDGGVVLVKIDRNPGRLIAVCRELWMMLQNKTFLQNDRYVPVNAIPSIDDSGYVEAVRDSFLSFVPGSAEWIGRKPSGPKIRPKAIGPSNKKA